MSEVLGYGPVERIELREGLIDVRLQEAGAVGPAGVREHGILLC